MSDSSGKDRLMQKPYTIPFNKPFIAGKELYYISQCIANGHASGDGEFTMRCQAFLEARFGAGKVLLTHSCTAALEMAAILIDTGPGDEILMPSYTFVSTANAFRLRGAVPRFVDIRADTLNIDERLIEAAITPRTKAIVVVHYAGLACDMDAIMTIAKKHGLFVIEDAAQAVNSKYGDKFLGTIGDIGCYSFHETKNVSCGEGGAIVLNNPAMIDRAEIIREKGTNRRQFFRGEVDKYSWVDIGSSYLPSDMLAAYLFAQLENMNTICQKRKQLFETYHRLLRPLHTAGLLQLPSERALEESNGHLFHIILKTRDERDALLAHLKHCGIYAVFHYVPLHLSHFGGAFPHGSLPVTEGTSARLIRLPMYYELTLEQQKTIVRAIAQWYVDRQIGTELAGRMIENMRKVPGKNTTQANEFRAGH